MGNDLSAVLIQPGSPEVVVRACCTARIHGHYTSITRTVLTLTLKSTLATNALNTTNTPIHADMHIRRWPGIDHAIG